MTQDNSNCYQSITVPKNSSISLFFQKFAAYQTTGCEQVGIEIRENGPKGTVLHKACGYYIPNPVFSSTNKVWIYSWNKNKYTAFYDLVYTSSDQGRGCGGFMFNYKGTFTSPLYPMGYKNTTACVWDIRVPIGRKLAFKFSGTYTN